MSQLTDEVLSLRKQLERAEANVLHHSERANEAEHARASYARQATDAQYEAETLRAQVRALTADLKTQTAALEQVSAERYTLRARVAELEEAFRGEAPDTAEAVIAALGECMGNSGAMGMAKHARQMEQRAQELKRERDAAQQQAAHAAESMRERCAKKAEEYGSTYPDDARRSACEYVATALRALPL